MVSKSSGRFCCKVASAAVVPLYFRTLFQQCKVKLMAFLCSTLHTVRVNCERRARAKAKCSALRSCVVVVTVHSVHCCKAAAKIWHLLVCLPANALSRFRLQVFVSNSRLPRAGARAREHCVQDQTQRGTHTQALGNVIKASNVSQWCLNSKPPGGLHCIVALPQPPNAIYAHQLQTTLAEHRILFSVIESESAKSGMPSPRIACHTQRYLCRRRPTTQPTTRPTSCRRTVVRSPGARCNNTASASCCRSHRARYVFPFVCVELTRFVLCLWPSECLFCVVRVQIASVAQKTCSAPGARKENSELIKTARSQSQHTAAGVCVGHKCATTPHRRTLATTRRRPRSQSTCKTATTGRNYQRVLIDAP